MSEEQSHGETVEGLSPKRFFVLIVMVATACLLLVAGVNVTVDPTGAYKTGKFPLMTDSTRELKSKQLLELDKETSFLILGSSRSMRVEPAFLSRWLGGKGYNAAVSSGATRDYHALLGLALDEVGLPIRHVVIGLDLEDYSPILGIHEKLKTMPELLKHIPEAFRPQNANTTPIIFQPLSSADLELSTKALRYEYLSQWPEPKHKIRGDGVREYIQAEAAIAEGRFKLAPEIETSISSYRGTYSAFTQLDENDLECLLAFFDRCDEAGIGVSMVLTTLHPDVISMLKAETEFVARREEFLKWINQQAAKRGYRFYDASELSSFGGDPTLFYDGSHARSENIELMLQKLFTDTEGSSQ